MSEGYEDIGAIRFFNKRQHSMFLRDVLIAALDATGVPYRAPLRPHCQIYPVGPRPWTPEQEQKLIDAARSVFCGTTRELITWRGKFHTSKAAKEGYGLRFYDDSSLVTK